MRPRPHWPSLWETPRTARLPGWLYKDYQQETLHPEALSFAVNVAQTQINIGADALHRLDGQRATKVLCVGPRRGQAEAKPMHWVRLIPTVGNAVEEVAHAGILRALLSCAEVVVHHLIYDAVRDAATTI